MSLQISLPLSRLDRPGAIVWQAAQHGSTWRKPILFVKKFIQRTKEMEI